MFCCACVIVCVCLNFNHHHRGVLFHFMRLNGVKRRSNKECEAPTTQSHHCYSLLLKWTCSPCELNHLLLASIVGPCASWFWMSLSWCLAPLYEILVDRKGITRNTTCFCNSRSLTLWSSSWVNIFTLLPSSHYKKSWLLSCPSWLKIWWIWLRP